MSWVKHFEWVRLEMDAEVGRWLLRHRDDLKMSIPQVVATLRAERPTDATRFEYTRRDDMKLGMILIAVAREATHKTDEHDLVLELY